MPIDTLIFYGLPLVISFALALIITWFVRYYAKKLAILDHPNNPRKIHSTPIPLWGGLALFITLVSLTLVFWFSGWLDSDRLNAAGIVALVVGSVFITVGGMLDDKFTMRPVVSFIWPVLAAIVVVVAGVGVDYITDPRGGIISLEGTQLGPVVIPLAVAFVWLLGMMYTTKLLDGLDGLVSGIGAIGAIIIFIVSLSWNEPFSAVSVLALVLAGTTLGFLVYNWHPASIFLGESGSLLIGFWLGMLSIISGSKIATTLLIMGIPILDVVWVIVRRLFREHKSIAEADRKHLHHRLLDSGLAHKQAVLVLYVLTVLFGSVALWQETRGKLIALGVLVVVMIILGTLLIQKTRKTKSI